MQTVSYETNAIFCFDPPEVVSVLKYYIAEYNANEATKLLRSIQSSSSRFIKISSHYFGFVVLALLAEGKDRLFVSPAKRLIRFNLPRYPSVLDKPIFGQSRRDRRIIRTLEELIPLLGIGRENQVLLVVQKLSSSDLEAGIKKGKELLQIYSKFVNSNV